MVIILKNILLDGVYNNFYAFRPLYEMLKERDDIVNISHKNLPSWEDHLKYVHDQPHKEWYLICNLQRNIVGQIYLSNNNEIGIQIFKEYHKKGYASEALKYMINTHKDKKLLANINPENIASQEFFKKHGFKLLQYTYFISA